MVFCRLVAYNMLMDKEKITLWPLRKPKRSLASEMWLVILTALMIFGIAFVIALLVLSRESRKDSEVREAETLIASVAGNLRSGIDSYKDISRLVMLNEKVTTFLNAKYVDRGIVNDARFGILDVLNVSTNLDSVFIFRNDNAYVSTGRAEYNVNFTLMNDPAWTEPIFAKRGGAVILMNANGAIEHKNGSQIITIARSIYDIYTQQKTGVLLINVSTKMLDMIVSVQETSRLCILAEDGTFLSGNQELVSYYDPSMPKETVLHTELKNPGPNRMISSYALADMPLVLICENSADIYSVPTIYIYMLTLLLGAFVIAIFFAVVFVSRRINKPIYELASAMERTKEAGWLKKVDLEAPPNEIGILVDSYNSVIDYLNDLFTRLLENEKSVQKAQMRVLNEQIKPHFLYNSLGTISYMAYEAGAMDVYGALETLSNFYRNFLSKGDREITVRREVSIIRDYLSLQKLRYGDIIQDEYDIQEETQDLMIPKLLLQPLVENCIYHGIRPKGEPGIIRITTRLSEDGIIVSVYDDGVGMSREAIERVMAGEAGSDEEEKHSGFGLKGTIDRIRFYCDNRDAVTIDSEEGEYTKITFHIPLKTR